MGIIKRSTDTYYTFRFLRILTTDWEDLEAYELGIIDENGKVLKKSRQLRTRDERSAYTIFHRLVFSIKRLLEKFPGGRTVMGRYAAALFLIKEYTGMSDEQLGSVLDKIGIDFDELQLSESLEHAPWFLIDEDQISPGTYTLTTEAVSISTAEVIGHPTHRVIVDENTRPIGRVLDTDIYRVRHADTGQDIYVTARDISR